MPGTNPLPTPLPADLPENWSLGQIVSPAGTDVGLTQQHGYNYLMEQVNAAQDAANTIGEAFENLATTQDLDNFIDDDLPGIIQQEAVSQVGSVVLPAAAWQQDPVSQLYTQPVTIPGLTANSKVDFDTDVATMAGLPAAIQPVNDNGTLTAVTLSPPETDIQVQVTVVNTKAVTIQTAPTIVTQLVNPLPVENEAYTFTFGAVGNVPFTWQLTGGSLPDGLSLSSTGVLSGTPTAQTGLMSFTVKVSNEYGEDTQTFSISVAGPSGIAVPDLPNGTLVQIQKDGSPVLFYKAVSDYESDLNGAGRQLMVRKDCYNQRQWNSSNVNAYATSTIDSSLNGEYKALFPQAVQEMMGATKFYYTPGNGNNAVSTLERAVFLLSATELGRSQSWFNVEGSILPIASALQIAQLNGIAVSQWTRSPDTYGTDVSIRFDENGMAYDGHCSNSYGCRPCFTLPATAMVNPTPNPDGSYTLIE